MKQWQQWRWWLYGVAAIGVCVLAYIAEPGKSKWLPPCLFHWATGLYCPGCGNTRALHALVHGNILESISNNLLLIPACVLLGIFHFFPKLTLHKYICWTLGVIVVAFFILRNLPWEPFTYLAPNPVMAHP